ncbi:uncharacterized protein LOC110678675 isoform X1 [Aedes aegypti]|uniref:Uncharacterized protein n=1 Tax=Aedes aegypti TaxID=7159 RepID=A0A6I8U1J8_AEDAE|nr:uncharacterized protein LOC110678675 isoform X1 [Aedes aegypti]
MKKQVLYKVQFEICCQNQRITKSRCECVAGAGNSSACKHCAALMCCVEDFVTTGTVTQDLGCTNTLQAWHRPPKHAPKRSINEPISLMLRKRQKTKETHYNRTISTSATTDFVNRSLNSGLNLSIHTSRKANIHGLANDHFYLRKSLFETTVEDINYVDENKASQLEQNTMGQNGNKSWFEARRSRITASNIKGICTAIRTSCTQNKACSVTPARYNFEAKDLSKIPAIAWGKSREKEAFQLFQAQNLSSKTFRECGLFIDLSRHYLAASPDGICCCRAEIIEIKCPYKIRFQEPTKADYLNDSGHLIRSHQYYYQVQFQLHVTRAKKCHFVVYTTKGIHVTTIPYDINFINSILPSLDKFYKEVFCEEYCKKFGFN